MKKNIFTLQYPESTREIIKKKYEAEIKNGKVGNLEEKIRCWSMVVYACMDNPSSDVLTARLSPGEVVKYMKENEISLFFVWEELRSFFSYVEKIFNSNKKGKKNEASFASLYKKNKRKGHLFLYDYILNYFYNTLHFFNFGPAHFFGYSPFNNILIKDEDSFLKYYRAPINLYNELKSQKSPLLPRGRSISLSVPSFSLNKMDFFINWGD